MHGEKIPVEDVSRILNCIRMGNIKQKFKDLLNFSWLRIVNELYNS